MACGRLTLVAALASMTAAAAVPVGQRAVTLELARGACSAAAAAAERVQAAARGDGAIADALALRTQVALDCQRPQTPGLEDWLSREHALRVQRAGADSAAVAEVDLQRIRREQQLNHLDAAQAAARALDERALAAAWPDALRGRIAARLASIANQRADAKAALAAAGRAESLARAARDDATLVSALQDRGYALARMRQGEQAAGVLAEASALAARRFGNGSREHAEALRLHGQCLRVAGDFGAAIDRFEQALAILRAHAEPDQRAIANTLLNLGQTRKLTGDGERAASTYEAALTAERLDPDPTRPTRAILLHALANLERDRGEPTAAVAHYVQAEPLFERHFGADSLQLAQVYNNHGNAEANLGRFAAAEALYHKAVAIARSRGSVDPADYLPLANLAMVQVWQGRYEPAEAGFREALKHAQAASAGSESSALFASMGLAASLWGQQRLEQALDAALAAERVREAALRLAASNLGEQQSVDLQDYLRPSLDLVLAIALADGSPAALQRAWQASMAARDVVTSIQVQRLAAARSADDPHTRALWQDWRSASAALARSELADEDATALAARRSAVDRAERALALATPLAASLAVDAPDFARIRRALPADTSLVLFATTRLRAPSDFARDATEQRSPELLALLLPAREAPVRVRRLGQLDAIEATIDAWSAALADRDTALAEVADRGRRVRAQVWQPLHEAGAGRHWLVLPTAALYRVPWGALPDGDGWLAERGASIHRIDHERELLAPALPATAPRLLALADPQPSASTLPARARSCAAQLANLPGARREAAAIDALWRARFHAPDASTLLLGAAASEAGLRAAIAGTDTLHLATHGVGLGSDCSQLAIADRQRGFALSIDAPLAADAPPITPVALLLSPGNGSGSDTDGLLTTAEIAALDLSHLRWAVLAACATASGSTNRYEGLFDLARAFRLAGAHTVFTSLWPVDDLATAEWSAALYRARLDRRLGAAAALATAQRELIQARRARGDSVHPYFWAAFSASGDWR